LPLSKSLDPYGVRDGWLYLKMWKKSQNHCTLVHVRLSGLINGRNQFHSWGFPQASHSGPSLCRTRIYKSLTDTWYFLGLFVSNFCYWFFVVYFRPSIWTIQVLKGLVSRDFLLKESVPFAWSPTSLILGKNLLCSTQKY
jgi:hypothetical protein